MSGIAATPDEFADKVQRFTDASGGALQFFIVRLDIELPELVAFGLTGDLWAMRMVDSVMKAVFAIEDHVGDRPPLCASCPRPLRDREYALVICVPHGDDDPRGAVALGVCQTCATTPQEIKTKVQEPLRAVWPSMREFTVTHHEPGRA